jgi:NADPH-dependent 2,4-dienoyl-CoA reductase/sulfur reductase-like enzyme/rhodanese-related sulfurtransferase
LPYYVGGEIKNRQQLFVTSVEQFSERYQVDVQVETEVTKLDRERRIVVLSHPSAPNREIAYDRLVLATGTVPIQPQVSGLDSGPVFFVRTIPDVDAICSVLEAGQGQHALVVGGGYIGLEVAEQFLHRGLKVTLLEIAAQIIPSLDPEMAQPVLDELRSAGAEVILEDGLSSMRGLKGSYIARTVSGREIPFDLAILATGVRPNVKLAAEAGIAMGKTGAIAVDQFQRTSDPSVFAAGDNSENRHIVLGEPVNIPLAGPANKAGRVAGANAAHDLLGWEIGDSRRISLNGVLGTSIVRVFGKTAAGTGLTEMQVKQSRFSYLVSYLPGSSHAGYYPGAEELLLKVVFEQESGRILGAQCVGGKGVDKRIDVLSTAIAGGLTVSALEQLDLCYAPPFGSAKDPLNQVGFSSANQQRSIMPAISPQGLIRELEGQDPPILIDVRTPKEFSKGHLSGSFNIPLHELRARIREIPKERDVVICCRSGHRSYLAQRILMNLGWNQVRNLSGGYGLVIQTRRALSG